MQGLRNATFLARLVLAWFVVAIGVAVASPVVKPQAMELVCSGGGGMKLLLQQPDGKVTLSAGTLDCPLCASSGAPAPDAGRVALLQRAPIHLQVAIAPAPATPAPRVPPARGPPPSGLA